jgi:hypothetical protein
MKKTLSILCVVLVVGFAGTAFAGRADKVDVCHNGSVYDVEIDVLPVDYDPTAWVPGSFVINISGNAVKKHEVNHGDSTSFEEGELVTTELVIEDNVITGFEQQYSCVPIIPQ